MSEFTIEYYPLTKKYFPKYGNFYLKQGYSTGIIREEDFFDVSDSFSTEEEAKTHIELFKEQKLKKNIKIIKVD